MYAMGLKKALKGFKCTSTLLHMPCYSLFEFLIALTLISIMSPLLQGSTALSRRDRGGQRAEPRQQDGDVHLLCHLLCRLPVFLRQHLRGSHHHHFPGAGGQDDGGVQPGEERGEGRVMGERQTNTFSPCLMCLMTQKLLYSLFLSV